MGVVGPTTPTEGACSGVQHALWVGVGGSGWESGGSGWDRACSPCAPGGTECAPSVGAVGDEHAPPRSTLTRLGGSGWEKWDSHPLPPYLINTPTGGSSFL